MKRGRFIFGTIVLLLAVALTALSVRWNDRTLNIRSAAERLGDKLNRRMEILDRYVEEAARESGNGWMTLEGLPSDMVVYVYRADTLQTWAHRFPLVSDDIRSGVAVQRIGGESRGEGVSPLSWVGEDLSYVNFGPKWYLAKARSDGDLKIIAGLEVVDETGSSSGRRVTSMRGINPVLGLQDSYTVQPLSGSTGEPVRVGGTPLFKLSTDTSSETPGGHNELFFWASIILFLAGLLLIITAWRKWPVVAVATLLGELFLRWAYVFGRSQGAVSQIFSPLLYAQGSFYYSLGAALLLNLAILVPVTALYVMRRPLLSAVMKGRKKVLEILVTAVLALAFLAITSHIFSCFRSIVLNSGICLELHKIDLLDRYTLVVYASFIFVSLALPMLAALASPYLRHLVHLRYNAFSRGGRAVYSLLTGAFFVVTSTLLGFQKEQDRVGVWATRLAMDRDISLEIQLRGAEQLIAEDQVAAALSALEGSEALLEGRIVDSYLSRLTKDYDISVIRMSRADASVADLFNERIRGGEPIASPSHFYYSKGADGRPLYTGFFTYYNPSAGSGAAMVLVESKSNREDRGYLSLLGFSAPGKVTLPPPYSYAKYSGGRLIQFKGTYGYPTVFPGTLPEKEFIHFIYNVSDEDVVVVSREKTEILTLLVAGMLLAILVYSIVSVPVLGKRRFRSERAYFRTRISVVLYISLIITLIAMSAFSVWFVYKRNRTDMNTIMVSRISVLQSSLEGVFRQVAAGSGGIPLTRDHIQSVMGIGNNLKCDISLYSPSGVLLMSTSPEVYDRMLIGRRIDENAYKSIILDHDRFSINRETFGRRHYYALYAPVFNARSEIVAIACSPYTEQSYDLQTEALTHIATIISAFFILLMLARIVTVEVIDRVFRPLSEMGRKMKVSDVDHLQYIIYEREDEISSLVRAYNLMVHDLSESTRELARSERDKAWSAMARQVAHEIKNPLTPIKIQLQMLIMMKESGNPQWTEKFDEVSESVLQHIDILSDTANEFSTFAKLYSEEPVEVDLDTLIREEVSLFSSREDISFEYFGLEGSVVSGPKPQLTRVLVNLITNAVQAVEGQEEALVRVSLRNSVKDGFYDIVVEDNGPGVKESDRSRLFVPEFTTKSKGSGLGLAICRNIIDKCGGEIFYARSFSLGGASFTVRYPKNI